MIAVRYRLDREPDALRKSVRSCLSILRSQSHTDSGEAASIWLIGGDSGPGFRNSLARGLEDASLSMGVFAAALKPFGCITSRELRS